MCQVHTVKVYKKQKKKKKKKKGATYSDIEY